MINLYDLSNENSCGVAQPSESEATPKLTIIRRQSRQSSNGMIPYNTSNFEIFHRQHPEKYTLLENQQGSAAGCQGRTQSND
jgi:hypothetical protein